MKKLLLILFCFPLISFGQGEWNNWYFGKNLGLDFGTNPPTVLSNSQMFAAEGCASISDSLGNLLFYSYGFQIWDSTHNIMQNGDTVNPYSVFSSTQGALIVKQPDSDSIYYLFSQVNVPYSSAQDTSFGITYTIIDMSLNNGLGGVIVKGVLLNYSPTSEKLCAVLHANGVDKWIVTHKVPTNEFAAFLLSDTGINQPVISNMGTPLGNFVDTWGTAYIGTAGVLKTSPNGKKLALVNLTRSILSTASLGGTPDFIDVYDFDDLSGRVLGLDKRLTFNDNWTDTMYYGLSFSPNSEVLYTVAHVGSASSGNSFLCAYDLTQQNPSPVIVPQPCSKFGDIQLAPDGRIYFIGCTYYNLSYISNPDDIQNFTVVENGPIISNNTTSYLRYGLPNIPHWAPINQIVPPLSIPHVLEKKKLKRIINIIGQETKLVKNTLLFYIYNDGTVEKRIVIE